MEFVVIEVRKHRAPKGALRLCGESGRDFAAELYVRKHQAPQGALRPAFSVSLGDGISSQKAPSAKRCIKTDRIAPYRGTAFRVRKHRAPKGALRNKVCGDPRLQVRVRKHRAPNGALRQLVSGLLAVGVRESQKAPSAKRCIKTHQASCPPRLRTRCVRKHRAPKGALRPRSR